MKKLILSAIMFISVAGIAVAQDTTGTKHNKSQSSKGMQDKKSKKSVESGQGQTGSDTSMNHSRGKAGSGKHTGARKSTTDTTRVQ